MSAKFIDYEASDLASNIGYDPTGAPDSFYSFVGGATGGEKLGMAEQNELPTVFALSQNYPNPFTERTSIQYAVAGRQVKDKNLTTDYCLLTTLRIYDLTGRLVRTLVDKPLKPGYYTVVWDGKDSTGKEVTTGIYFYKLQVDNFTHTNKMILIR